MVAVPVKTALAESKEVQLKSLKSGTGQTVAQLAGTKPNTSSTGGKYRIKLSSAREKFTYENRVALGLANVLPNYYPVKEYNTENFKTNKWGEIDETGWFTKRMVTSVELTNGAFVVLKSPIPEPNSEKKLLVIESLGYEPTEEQLFENPHIDTKGKAAEKIFMDVKIGTYTKSGEQFNLEGANFATQFLKKIEHNIKDLSRDSRGHGYDIDLAGDKQKFEDAYRNKEQGVKLKLAMMTILEKLVPLRDNMRKAPITFVGSSLLIAFNLTRPESSDVKLIDPDHPIVLDEGKNKLEKEAPKDVMTSEKFVPTPDRWESGGGPIGGMPVLIPGRNYSDYVKKWKSGFRTGMDNFIKWLSEKMYPLPD